MSTKRKHKKANRGQRNANRRKSARAKINCAGLKLEVPPELDLPAGAPFATTEPAPSIPDDIRQLLRPLVAIATNAWRAKKKMTDPTTGEPVEEMRRVYRFVESIFTALEDAGVRVFDSAGKIYDSGMALKVLSFDYVPGLSREEIIKTISPSVVWQGRLLQMGEVIVGVPEAPEPGGTPSETTAGVGPQASDEQEPLSPQACGTSHGPGTGSTPRTQRSPDPPDGQEGTRSATPAGPADAENDEAARDARQLDAHSSSRLRVTDAPGTDNSITTAYNSAGGHVEGANDEQNNARRRGKG